MAWGRSWRPSGRGEGVALDGARAAAAADAEVPVEQGGSERLPALGLGLLDYGQGLGHDRVDVRLRRGDRLVLAGQQSPGERQPPGHIAGGKQPVVPHLPEAAGQDMQEEATNEVRPGHRLFCLLYTSPSPRDRTRSRMPSSA